MSLFTRRELMQGGTAVAAASALTGPALLDWAKAWAQAAPWKPEKGAQISLLRWKRFIQAEEDAFMELVANLHQGDRRQGQSSPTNRSRTCSPRPRCRQHRPGPRHVLGSLFAAAPVPAEVRRSHRRRRLSRQEVRRLGAVGGQAYGKSGNKWIGIPVAYNGNVMNYRNSSMEKAGFKEFPKTTDEFLGLLPRP